jgi:hypothetical protein
MLFIICFLAYNHVTLGLVCAFIFIMILTTYTNITEGLEDRTSVNNTSSSSQINDVLKSVPIQGSDFFVGGNNLAASLTDLQPSITPVQSNQIPVDSSMNTSDEVNASSKELFSSATPTGSSESSVEQFSLY